MGVVTYIFLTFALIGALHCAPIDEYTAKPPSAISSNSATTLSAYTQKHDWSSSSSDESKESSEDHKRQSRGIENNPVTASHLSDSSTSVIQTSAPITTRDDSKSQPQLPARETRDTEHDAAILPAPVSYSHPGTTYQDGSTSSTTSTTTAKSS